MMDYLQFYNNLDVYPLHKAVTKMAQVSKQHSIDLLKETLTLISAANKSYNDQTRVKEFFVQPQKQGFVSKRSKQPFWMPKYSI